MKEAEELKQTLDEIDSIDMDEAVPEEIEEDKASEHTGAAPEPVSPTAIDAAAPT